MNNKYMAPAYNKGAFNCPHCGAYSHQEWSWHKNEYIDNYGMPHSTSESFFFAECTNCKQYSIWLHEEMVYPIIALAEHINDDAPDDIKEDYEEARQIVQRSPRAANALLRLALQKLCIYLGAVDGKLDDMIAQLVAEKGLSPKIQKAMDAIRLYGNSSVHISEIKDGDTMETALKLFRLINVIIDTMITDEKLINGLIDNVSDGQKKHIVERSKKKK